MFASSRAWELPPGITGTTGLGSGNKARSRKSSDLSLVWSGDEGKTDTVAEDTEVIPGIVIPKGSRLESEEQPSRKRWASGFSTLECM